MSHIFYNELNVENTNFIIEKAKTKKDGVYSARGIMYRVKNGGVTHYGAKGKIYAAVGHFVTPVGSYDWSDEGKKLLKSVK